MVEKIFNEIQENKFYAISIDETQDISKKEQLTFVIRYVSKGVVKERLLGMYDAYCELDEFDNEHSSLTGENMAKIVLKLIDKLGLNKEIDHTLVFNYMQ